LSWLLQVTREPGYCSRSGARRRERSSYFPEPEREIASWFVLNADFTNLKVFVLDQDGDGDNEIGIGGVESKGFFERRGVSDL
jgi:hypothetical protein